MPVIPEPLWERWEEIDALLERALDLPSVERELFLESACGGDPELLRTMRSLARLTGEAASPVIGPAPELLRAALVERPG